MDLFINPDDKPNVQPAPNGWRFRKVGEIMQKGDLKIVNDWGECCLLQENLIGSPVLGRRDGFNDMVLAPRLRKKQNK